MTDDRSLFATLLEYHHNSSERVKMDLIFCMKINVKVFFKLIPLFLMAIASYAQSTKNSKFAKCLKYFRKEVRNELDFSHAGKHQTFP